MKVLIAIPAYNEADILEKNIIKLHDFLKKIKHNWRIIISNNASQDKTLEIAKKLAKKYKKVSFVSWKDRPKSLSIKRTWLKKEFDSYDIYSYMDADLSTDIKHFPQLIEGVKQGYDIAIGSRIIKARSFLRAILSKGLLLILKIFFQIKIKDFQCGFKAINRKTRNEIIPKMKAVNHGFMDTEMLVVANHKGYKIKEIPVSWSDERKSKVRFVSDIIDTFKNILRIKKDLILGRY